MYISEVLKRTDHTLLKKESTWNQIKGIVDDGIAFKTASVCIPPSFVKRAADYAKGRVAICTVIGFPNGYSTTEVKVFEAADAVSNGADEIDMVIDVGMVKERRWGDIEAQIREVKKACSGRILKVIIETCLLTDEEKIKMCEVVSSAKADFIKTSTGFSTGGATSEDVALIKAHVAPEVKIKAAGGVASIGDAENFIKLGAERIGTSSIIKYIKNM